MDFTSLVETARERLDPGSFLYQMGTADPTGAPAVDEAAWQRFSLIPRLLRGLTEVDVSTTLLGTAVRTPVMVAATAGHVLSHPDAEHASAAAAAAVGALFCYSNSATVEVGEFGRRATGPWWAQVYLMKDRGRTRDYLDRAVAAGARALVFTVDNPGTLGDAPFRGQVQSTLTAPPGNFPGWTWTEMSAQLRPDLQPDQIGELAEHTGLPVVVKGILHPADALTAVSAGAAGIVVSNHGRRQLAGVIPTARALPAVVDAVAGAVPVLVDGGVRSGTDVLRALARGAAGVGIGRPVLWGLAADGTAGVVEVLTGLTAELRQAMAGVGAATIGQLTRDLLDS